MKRDAVALYESLARWQWWRRRLRRHRPGQGLEMRKRLLPSPQGDRPTDGADGLDRWLQVRLGSRPRATVLDLGCGFGISLQRWLQRGSHRALGVTPSAYQVHRARQVATGAGVADRCAFARRELQDAVPDGATFDVVLAIEALGHAPDLAAVLAGVGRWLTPRGTLLWVEDLLREPLTEDTDVQLLAQAWRSPPLRDVATVRRLLAAGGLHIVDECDLTMQVPSRDPESIARSLARARRFTRLLPLGFARDVGDAFAGGFALERLYARGAACYLSFMVERADAS